RQRYAARRETLAAALRAAGFRIDHSEAGLYLWATRGEDSARTVDWLAHRGTWSPRGRFTARRGPTTWGWRSPLAMSASTPPPSDYVGSRGAVGMLLRHRTDSTSVPTVSWRAASR